MGLFSKSSSTTNVKTESKDNRVAIEGTPQGIFLSPESTLSQSFEGDYGFSGDDVSRIVGGLVDANERDEERSAEHQKKLVDTFKGQTDKLSQIIESLKSGGASDSKYLPYAALGLLGLYLLLGRR